MDPSRSFAQLRTDVFRLHDQGQYDRALDLIAQEAGDFPEEASGITYWRICLLARCGDKAEALRAMTQAVEAGWWRSERILRQDPDLASLRGEERFERLAVVCQTRQESAQRQVKSVMKTLVPERAAPPTGYPLVIALHGFGGNVADFENAWKHLPTQGWLVALPQASEVVDRDGYAWWDHELAGRQINAQFAALCARYRVDESRVVLAGFSQGGVMATWLALRDMPVRARGILGIVPGLRGPEIFEQPAEARRSDLRAYIVVGGRDFAVARARRFAAALQSGGLLTKVEEQAELDHEIPAQFDEVTKRALDFIDGG